MNVLRAGTTACMIAAVAACSAADTETSSTSTTSTAPVATRCPPQAADPTSADEVADAVALTLACHDTRSDTSLLDATKRAAPWLDESIRPADDDHIRTDATWLQWSEDEAWTPATVETIYLEEVPDYSSDTFTLYRETISTPQDDHGTAVSPVVIERWALTMTSRDGTWIVVSVDKL